MPDTSAINSGVSVLIIDDDEDDYQIICDLLEDIDSNSFQVAWESCYDSGLARLGSDRFDVCLAGYYIGGRTGTGFVKAAKEAGTACPIILLSGVAYQGADVATTLLGVAGFLDKSELTSDLIEKSIARAVEGSRI